MTAGELAKREREQQDTVAAGDGEGGGSYCLSLRRCAVLLLLLLLLLLLPQTLHAAASALTADFESCFRSKKSQQDSGRERETGWRMQ